ncbi:ATP-binding protein [Streptomyces niger]|uniref:ATP-binding protein n=1 Tax=Streptomyces niger TaxID=66373 RepID=UPI00069B8A69|nr:ATP-binding protein [Streptomyces niger]
MAASQSASLTLPSACPSVGEARRFAAQTLSKWGLPEDSETNHTVQLIVSELATNAVLHTRGQSPTFTVCMLLDQEKALHVGVTDSHPNWPRRLPAAVQEDNGRGMRIVRSLTAASGGRLSVFPTEEGGKTVRAFLPWPGPGPGGQE